MGRVEQGEGHLVAGPFQIREGFHHHVHDQDDRVVGLVGFGGELDQFLLAFLLQPRECLRQHVGEGPEVLGGRPERHPGALGHLPVGDGADPDLLDQLPGGLQDLLPAPLRVPRPFRHGTNVHPYMYRCTDSACRSSPAQDRAVQYLVDPGCQTGFHQDDLGDDELPGRVGVEGLE